MTNLILIKCRWDYTDTVFPRYNSTNTMLIRTGVLYANINFAHYDMAVS